MRIPGYRIILFSIIAVLMLVSHGYGEGEENIAAFSLLKIPEYAVEVPLSFAGEKLFYNMSWKGIKAAEAELETGFAEGSKNRVYHVQARSRTTGTARMLWRMDDWAEVFTNKEDLQPREYRLHIRETLINYDMNVSFNQDQTYVKSTRIMTNNKKERHFQCHHAYDPGSAALLIRSLEWQPGQSRWFEIVEGNERHLLILEAVAVESVTVQAGTFTTVKLAPSLIDLPKKAQKEDQALMQMIEKKEKDTSIAEEVYVWMALEGNRPIVKTWAKAFIGYVELELTRMEQIEQPAKF